MGRTVKVCVTYTFKGYYVVQVISAKTAAKVVKENCSMTLSNGIYVAANKCIIPDWNFPVHPEVEITGVSYEQDKQNVLQLAK